MNYIWLLTLAIAPGVTIAYYIYWRDKHEPEPVHLLIKSFVYGILAVFLTVAITIPLNKLIVIREDSIGEQAIHAFVIVALVEELSKFVFVRGILYRDKNFNEPFDGIVYSAMVGMGFATMENVYYVLNSGEATAFLRMFTAVPAHALFAVIMGFYLGKAKFDHKREGLLALMALGAATFFHGIYDYFLFISFVPGMWIMAFVSLFVAFYLSKKAMEIHEEASPFKKELSDNHEPEVDIESEAGGAPSSE